MRDHISICLRSMTGYAGPFHKDMEAFWREVEGKYKACNVMMVPQDHIPLWAEIAKNRGIPLAQPPPVVAEVDPYHVGKGPMPNVDLRTKEGREWKAKQQAGELVGV